MTAPTDTPTETETAQPKPRKRWHFWPAILLVALCWTLVWRDPAARHGLMRAWQQPYASRFEDHRAQFEFDAFRGQERDRRVQVDALARSVAALARVPRGDATQRRAQERQIETQARRLNDDPLVLALLLRARLVGLHSNRVTGALSNPNFPAAPPKTALQTPESPPAYWLSLLNLARRGQALDPQNAYFDWRVIYALLALRRDDEAREALQIAARKSRYEDPHRALIVNRLALMREFYGLPLSPRDHHAARQIADFARSDLVRQRSAHWLMESAIDDRLAGRHGRALDTAGNLIRLGRVTRQESHFLRAAADGFMVETIAMNRIVPPPGPGIGPKAVRYSASLGALQGSPISLYPYAQSQKRADITRLINAEWPQLKRYDALRSRVNRAQMDGFLLSLGLTAAERERSILLRVLPSILLAGALLTLLGRGRDGSGARQSGFWLGLLMGATLLLGAAEQDFFLYFERGGSGSPFTNHLGNQGLLGAMPLWVWAGMTLALIAVNASSALTWQKRQVAPRQGWKAELQKLVARPADGLARHDFGPVLALTAQMTGISVLCLAFMAPIFDFGFVSRFTGVPAVRIQGALMSAALLVGFAAMILDWRAKPRRRATFYLALRLMREGLLGFLVACSLTYAALALFVAPHAQRFDRDARQAVVRGEVQIARSRLGL